MIFCIFYIFFSESHILWNIVANIKKKNYTSEIDQIFIYRKKQVCCVILWLCRNIFIARKNVANFCVATFYFILL